MKTKKGMKKLMSKVRKEGTRRCENLEMIVAIEKIKFSESVNTGLNMLQPQSKFAILCCCDNDHDRTERRLNTTAQFVE
jgi:hypothetical protein